VTLPPSSPRRRGSSSAAPFAVCGLVISLLLLPVVAFADSTATVPVRIGSHEGYGRIVFDLPSRTDYHVTQQGQHVVIQFTSNLTIGKASGAPHNVLGITGSARQNSTWPPEPSSAIGGKAITW
jgi:hypothetical protein